MVRSQRIKSIFADRLIVQQGLGTSSFLQKVLFSSIKGAISLKRGSYQRQFLCIHSIMFRFINTVTVRHYNLFWVVEQLQYFILHPSNLKNEVDMK